MPKGFFRKVYAAEEASDMRELYDAWSASYDAELDENGYATPQRCAEALDRFTDQMSAPVLDFGCGTGLSGLALARAGFRTIDGFDPSADMLKRAEEKKVYRRLRQIDVDKPPPFKAGEYAAIAAIGVIGAGAAPISTFDALMKRLPSGGKLVLSFNDHTLADPANEGRLCEWIDCGAARLLFREYGDHLPGLNLKSYVYVIERR